MYIADLHIHSRYSRATSRDCTPEQLDLWAGRKGIGLVGTGDFTHPAWREELKEKLTPEGNGLYILKEEHRAKDAAAGGAFTPRFVVTGEISSIYKKNGRVRKVHSLILLPGLEEAELVSKKLETIGNIHSDGRPILGLDCHDLLEIVLELCPEAVFVPAHIWTPHFSLFGAFSGFDTVEECFGDLSPHIHAMETGLSSDPPMNWRVSALDRYQLISNSDAHSPSKLGREANLLDTGLSYGELKEAIEQGKGLLGTIEFFPEEGKYHYDGHRKCNVCLSPGETAGYNGICPVCGKKLTIGVSNRIEQLADRSEGYVRADAGRYESLAPLPEVIAASTGHSAAGPRVQKQYLDMLRRLGPEFDILRTIPVEEIRSASEYLIAEGIRRLREGKVERIPGFDGEYGTIRLFSPSEIEDISGQMSFFDLLGVDPRENGKRGRDTERQGLCASTGKRSGDGGQTEDSETGDGPAVSENGGRQEGEPGKTGMQKEREETARLNGQQEKAVRSTGRRIAVIAGPGTGKTKTLVARLVYLLENRKVKPAEITAVTFTNQAAGEMRERVRRELGRKRSLAKMQIGTFHAICLSLLKDQGLEFTLIDETEAREIAGEAARELGMKMSAANFLNLVSAAKSRRAADGCGALPEAKDAVNAYQRRLEEKRLLDFDDLLLETLRLFREKKVSEDWSKRFSYLLVDEFQDINPLQYALMEAWNEKGRELFVIGDPDQSIYGFRGADAECFVRLKKAHEELEVVSLLDNYRSSPQILEAALRVISENPGGSRKLLANRPSGPAVRLTSAGTELGEAIFIAKEINRLAGGIGMLEAHEISGAGERPVRGFDDIAVLYRTHRQTDILEKCLKKEGIPYVVAGRETFLQDDAVRGSVCFFRYTANPEDEYAREQGLKLLLGLKLSLISEEILETMAEKYRPLYTGKKPRKILEQWMEDMGLEGHGAMKKLADMTVFYKSMADFLEALTLGTESDLKRCGDKVYASGAVTLMTLHGSKGLEFPAVLLYGAEKGKIPFEREGRPVDREEERRLFYVGMTRAREELILTCSGEKSEFLQRLPEELLSVEEAHRRKEECRQMNLFEL